MSGGAPREVLLTGGFGVIGKWVLKELLRRGHRVTVFELDNPRTRRLAKATPQAKVIWGDLRDAAGVSAAVGDNQYVIHLGCLLPPMAEDAPELCRAVNVGGTQNIISACEASPVRPRLVHGSSGEVYGATRHLSPPRRLDDPRRSVNHYSASKIAAEEVVEDSQVDHVIVRFSAVPDISLASSHPLMFDFPADGRMELLHPADAAFAIANCLERDGVWGRKAVLPLAGGEHCRTTYGGFVNGMLETLGVGALPDGAFAREDYPSDWHDTTESQALLEYQRHSLDDIYSEVRGLLGWRRAFVPVARPFVRWSLLRKSPHLNA
ncbi:MAG: NAD(P)-dependent oxidoreductase [Deltaproteobacteria bacterium]|nr:NAD(P)-dependent oxidoreductase [Deltaproteobacteria bacterium]